MLEDTLSSVLIVESDDKVYFVEKKGRRSKLKENKSICENVKNVNKNKPEIFDKDKLIDSPVK